MQPGINICIFTYFAVETLLKHTRNFAKSLNIGVCIILGFPL